MSGLLDFPLRYLPRRRDAIGARIAAPYVTPQSGQDMPTFHVEREKIVDVLRALRDDDERVRLIETVRTAVPGDRRVVAGAGAESTRRSVALAHAAAAAGADAVLVITPHYYSGAMTPDRLVRLYNAQQGDIEQKQYLTGPDLVELSRSVPALPVTPASRVTISVRRMSSNRVTSAWRARW